MKKIIFSLLFLSISLFVQAQKVATYSTGTPGDDNYESFGFWIKDGERSFISYVYGSDRKQTEVSYGGKGTYKGVPCFKVRFTNKLVLNVMVNGNQLQIADNSGNYLKTFKWEYEGPVDGKGAFCNVCATDALDAVGLLKNFYL